MQPFPKQSHDVRSPALEQVCNSVCGPRTKKFGDPCSTPNREMNGACTECWLQKKLVKRLFRFQHATFLAALRLVMVGNASEQVFGQSFKRFSYGRGYGVNCNPCNWYKTFKKIKIFANTVLPGGEACSAYSSQKLFTKHNAPKAVSFKKLGNVFVIPTFLASKLYNPH